MSVLLSFFLLPAFFPLGHSRGVVVTIPVLRKVLRENVTDKLGVEFDRYGQRLQNNRDIEYKGVVSLGNQKFTVVFDTGSDLPLGSGRRLSVRPVPFVSTCKSQVGVYNASKSRTSKALGRSFSIGGWSQRRRSNCYAIEEYGTGSAVGSYYQDYFAFGDPRGPQLKLRRPVTLSFPQKGSPTPVFQQAVQEGLMDAPIFTAWFRKCNGDCANGGLISLGSQDLRHCVPVRRSHWVPVERGAVHWTFTMDGIAATDYRHAEKTRAITDTGTSFIVGPSAVVDALAKRDRRDGGGRRLLRSVKFVLVLTIRGYRYPIAAEQLILRDPGLESSGLCVLAMSGSDDFDFWILGAPFIRTYCQVHDVRNYRVAFPRAK
ncbi:Eukaryotic aspartyl protease [Aphelenchoides fujianensis]|nr:Eukaryotic aspartyl protease [Aphelenchoides fujianensis]